ncbi:MAG TPA: carboxypeptidase regulatory-like domain-containing protein [Gemmatimonas sp.]|uniref:carboxypeptidase regulatory-like domain-containing protein n=1 Tax=Gemmatimonas sp. TaxID=1962908 RepID=UPI002EDA3691
MLLALLTAFLPLWVAPSPARTVQDVPISGTVRAAVSQRPVAGAEVSIVGTDRQVRSDSAGRFTLTVARPGPVRITARAIGHREHSIEVEVTSRGLDDLVIPLEPITELQQVETRADPLRGKPNLRAFEERRKFGTGRFLDSIQLGYPDPLLWSNLLPQRIPGLRIVTVGSKRVYAGSRGIVSLNRMPRGDQVDQANRAPIACYITVIVDGVRLYGGGPDESLLDITRLGLGRLLAAEYYSVSQLPPQYNSTGTAVCGTLMLWTQY